MSMFGGSKSTTDGKGSYGAVPDEKKSGGPFGKWMITRYSFFFSSFLSFLPCFDHLVCQHGCLLLIN